MVDATGDDAPGRAAPALVRLLSFTAEVRSNSQAVQRSLGQLYPASTSAHCRPAAGGTSRFEVVEERDDGLEPVYRVRAPEQEVQTLCSAPGALAQVEHLINVAAARSLGHHLLLHAGAVAAEAGGVLIPGASGAGKSTLVAALCLVGFDYYSDDVAVVEAGSLALRPFPKAICLKDGGWQALGASFDVPPSLLQAARADGELVHYLPPPRTPASEVGVPIRYILIPQRRVGARAALEPARRSRVLVELAQHSLNLPKHGARGLEVLARVTEGAECYALTYDDLRSAVYAIRSLVSRR